MACCGRRRHANVREEYFEELASQSEKITVLVAGKPRRGKSTALSNLFDGDLEARIKATSVTHEVIESTKVKDRIPVRFIDAPGLTAVDNVDTGKCLREMREKAGQDNFILLYCISAMDPLDESDESIMRYLSSCFGSDIWERCIILLTFSDSARRQHFRKKESYIANVNQYASNFGVSLGKYIPKVPPVRWIFDCQHGDVSPETIVVVPVAKTRKDGRNPSIIPGLRVSRDIDWPELAFLEIVKKSRWIATKNKKKGGVPAGAVGGAVVGASVGASVGALVGGPFGAVVGGTAGAAVGLLGGTSNSD